MKLRVPEKSNTKSGILKNRSTKPRIPEAPIMKRADYVITGDCMAFTEEMLKELFAELGLDYASWSAGLDLSNMTDAEIYDALPDAIKELISDIPVHKSWDNDGF